MSLPLTSLWYYLPSDGCPLLPTWRNNAIDIYWSGFDALREPLECKVRPGAVSHGSAQCTKGLGRLSVIYFGALYTFLKKDILSNEMKDDFCRCPSRLTLRVTHSLDMQPCIFVKSVPHEASKTKQSLVDMFKL